MSWICFGNMNLCIWCQLKPFEHEWEKTWWGSVTQKVCFWVCFVWCFLDRTSKAQQSNKLVLFASHLTQACVHGICTLTTPQHTHNHTNAANHSSIFYARMRKTSATLCKLQLMCVREEKAVSASWEYKSGENEWVGAEADEEDGKREEYVSDTRKDGQKEKDWGSEVRYCSFCAWFFITNQDIHFFSLCYCSSCPAFSSFLFYLLSLSILFFLKFLAPHHYSSRWSSIKAELVLTGFCHIVWSHLHLH